MTDFAARPWIEDRKNLALSEVISALSYALDLTEGQPPGHCLRSCWIGMQIGMRCAMATSDLWDLYYTLLLKDAGCSSNAARLCELYGQDERAIKRDFKWVDTNNLAQMVQFVLTHTGVRGQLADRFRRVLRLAREGEQLGAELIQTRCERGADIARRLGFGEAVASGIYSLDEHWDGRGKPARLQGEQIPLQSRIALLSQVIDVFFQIGGQQAALDEITRRRGHWFDPQLVDIALSFADSRTFWSTLDADEIEPYVLELEPESRQIEVDDDLLDQIAEAFGQVVDSKSPFTAGHSERVALYTDIIAAKLGLDRQRRRWLKRGALLHDIGKLGVSNSILDKEGKLTEEEWREMRRHPVYTEQILERISPFHEMAFISGAHHERLDGKGYPRGLMAADVPLETRIVTVCDIFDALTAARPYRGPLPVSEALEIMSRMVGSALDSRCFNALRECVHEMEIDGS